MNAKTTAGIISIITVLCGTIYAYKVYNTQPELTTREQCSIENPVGCDELISNLQVEYNNLTKRQFELNKKADVYRAIKKLELSPIENEKLN